MRRTLLLATLLAACSQPTTTSTTAEAPTPVVVCNQLTPDAGKQVAIENAAAATVAELRGGRVTPGTYDLSRALQIGDATGWSGTRAVVLEVSEGADGAVRLNWAGAEAGGAVDSWTATLAENPARLTYTCGRMGDVTNLSVAADATTLRLVLPDGASGQLSLDFIKRA